MVVPGSLMHAKRQGPVALLRTAENCSLKKGCFQLHGYKGLQAYSSRSRSESGDSCPETCLLNSPCLQHPHRPSRIRQSVGHGVGSTCNPRSQVPAASGQIC